MKITLPIRGPEKDYLYNEYERFLKDVLKYKDNKNLLQLIDSRNDYKSIESIEFKILEGHQNDNSEPPSITTIKLTHSFFHTEFITEFLEISLNLIKEDEVIKTAFCEIIINDILQRLCLLVNLSYAAKVDFLPGVIYSNKNKYVGKTLVLLNTLDFAYEHSNKIGWPILKGIKIEKTIEWFVKNKIHTDETSRNKTHRAINAFSYLFNNIGEKDTSILFWTMLGIESILAKGNNNITNQIKTKSSLILGEPKEYKKKLNKLYDYRSRLIHGDINFPPKFSSDYELFEVEYWDYLAFATSILLAIIRDMIEKGIVEYKFNYILET